MNILFKANEIVNKRSQEKKRSYGDFNKSMENMAEIFNSLTGLKLTAVEMYKAMIALKFSRESFSHKEDNLLDACAYIGALNNYINNKTKQSWNKKKKSNLVIKLDSNQKARELPIKLLNFK